MDLETDEITQEITAKLAEQGIGVEEKQEPVEEIKKEEEITQETSEESLQLSDTEKEAYEKGWRPDGPKSADEFLRAEPLYDEIKYRGKEIKELKATVEDMKAMMLKQQEYADRQRDEGYKQALADLESQKRDAVELGDIEEYDKIQNEINELRELETPKQQQIDPVQALLKEEVVQDFLKRNESWLVEDSIEANNMKENVRLLGNGMMQKGYSPEQIVSILDAELAKAYPNRFGKSKPSNPVEVETIESGVNTTGKKSKLQFRDLTKEHQQIGRRFVKEGIFKTQADYVEHILKVDGGTYNV